MDSLTRILLNRNIPFVSCAGVRGASGVLHRFDLLITYDGSRFGLDYARGEEEDAIRAYVKWLDTGLKVMLALRSRSDDAAAFLLSYYDIRRIRLYEPCFEDELLDALGYRGPARPLTNNGEFA